MTTYIGSARHDEHGACYSGGKAGDQLQESNTMDTQGEVSQQPFYVHSKGWQVLRAKERANRSALGSKMRKACNNSNIGYDQSNRLAILRNGTGSTTKTECDCSSLVRQCVIEACGKDPGNFTTADELEALLSTGLFTDKGRYTSSLTLCVGDILVTSEKGHTAIVTATGEEMNINELPLIKYGSKGGAVAMLQGCLKYKGYSLTVDGDFGTNTAKQVKKYQKNRGLAQDGICGSDTWQRLTSE